MDEETYIDGDCIGQEGKNQGKPGTELAEMAGEFCYYYTFGLDAEGAYRFDHLRKTKPHLTKKRKINMFWYMYFIVRTGA